MMMNETFQVVPFDLAPLCDHVKSAMARCNDSFEAAMREQQRAAAHAEQLKAEHERISELLTDVTTGTWWTELEVAQELISFFKTLRPSARTEKNKLQRAVDEIKKQNASLSEDNAKLAQQLKAAAVAAASARVAVRQGADECAPLESLHAYVAQLQQEHAATVAELKKKHEAELMQLQSAVHRALSLHQQMARK
jgi:myosin heavy subunit